MIVATLHVEWLGTARELSDAITGAFDPHMTGNVCVNTTDTEDE